MLLSFFVCALFRVGDINEVVNDCCGSGPPALIRPALIFFTLILLALLFTALIIFALVFPTLIVPALISPSSAQICPEEP
jgi:hypothetical protein